MGRGEDPRMVRAAARPGGGLESVQLSVRFKDFAIKNGGDVSGNGGFTGYASTFDRDPDCYGDVIAKGAFAETLAEWRESGRPIPLLYDHNFGDPDYNIGTVTAEEDDTGLLVHASYDGSPKAQRVRELVKDGRLCKMSFAFDILDEGTVELEDGTKANEIRKVDLYEVSVVLVPANSHAEIIEAKSLAKYGATISKATGKELHEVLDAIDGIREEADEAARRIRDILGDEGDPSGGAGQGDNADEGGDEEEPAGANSSAKSRESIAARLKSLLKDE